VRITTTTNVTVDGVMQGLGAPGEDERGGFTRGGWAAPHMDDEANDYLIEVYSRVEAFLFGRRTWEIFAGSWGALPEISSTPIGVALNSRPKYLVSSTVTDPEWAGTRVLSGDPATAVRDLLAQPGGEILVPGSGILVRWLLANDLVDRLELIVFPVVVGQGTRLFPDTGPDLALELTESRSTPKGITIQTYRPVGRPEYAQALAPT